MQIAELKDALKAKDQEIERLEATLRGAYTENKAYAKRIAELEGALREIAKRQDPMGGEAYIAKQALGG